jgi:glutathione S-transferase
MIMSGAGSRFSEEARMKTVRFKLYHSAALRSARVKWLLHELVGDDFDVEYVDIYGAEQYSSRYLAINPNHCVPTLEITMENGDSMNMIESAAMITLLADAFPEKGLAPAAGDFSLRRADYLQILYFGTSMDMMLWQIRIHEHVLPERERDIRTVQRYRKKFANEVEPQLRARLEKARFICGDEFSAADCIIAYDVSWARGYQLCDDEVFKCYLDRVSERPAYVRAFSDVHGFKREVPRQSPIVELFSG